MPLIVITGATGFLGSHLLPHLLATGEPVTALVRDEPPSALRRLLRAVAAVGDGRALLDDLPSRVRFLRADLSAPALGLSGHEHRELAGAARQIWHCAALTTMTADPSLLRHVNVEGTRRVLELAGAAPRARLLHVSTAYVCGARQGLVREDDLDDGAGFLNPYEESKFAAERLVRSWAREHGQPVTVFRPSVLVSDRRRPPRTPRHPLSVLGRGLRLLAEEAGPPAPVGLAGSSAATTNLLPATYAARAMAAVAAAPPGHACDTYHVVHAVDTPVTDVLEAMSDVCPDLSVRLTADPRPLDARFAELTAGFHRYAASAVRFDRTRLDTVAPLPAPPPPVTRDYLRKALSS
ncbi:SDR family oxidoreductase [Streptomyces griseocarneus]|uniref:SDR family oxidoreductase n=1 Tax=Streptomyces griseocarneus TaxID=51201 RepID=A0ABX7RMV2_9ACTN|nr:SDR family oxidoreductase [Streptomyces griseocarneus]QSY49562.1 SDR family oxidoreductase [Streptomyces griseocarneus]